jgi:hypothetical protein
MNPTKLAALAAATMTMSLAACGGGDSKDNKPLSKADYIAKGDAICKKEGAKIDAVAAKLGQKSSEADFANFQKTIVSGLDKELSGLRGLEPPKADADHLNAIYDEVDAIKQKIADAKPSEIPNLFPSDPFAKPNKEAVAYGFKECGK